MISTFWRRGLLCLALLFALTPLLFSQAQTGKKDSGAKTNLKTGKLQQFKGKVVPLADLLKKIGSQLDPAAAPHWLALVTDDGKIYPLIRDAGSKMFYTDPTVRNRPMRLTGRLFADTHLLQVLDVRSFKNGQLCDIYYWCDICAIRRNAGGVCDCCGGPLELREVPLKK